MGYRDNFRWAKYVPVAERKQKTAQHIKSSTKKGEKLQPIAIEGRLIAKTFWGKAWCENLESYSDFENRLPRGRTYVRNGSVIDLQITKGKIVAQVMGSSLYRIAIEIKPMMEAKWKTLVKACAGKIDSLIELLQGKFSKAVMEVITQKEGGLFPKPQEITMNCSCPDYAGMCKHVAAVMYGVGARLDSKPEWLFALRHVDHVDLIASAGAGSALMQQQASDNVLQDNELSALFGIEMDAGKTVAATTAKPLPKAKKVKAKVVETTPAKTISRKAISPKSESIVVIVDDKTAGKKPKAKSKKKVVLKKLVRIR